MNTAATTKEHVSLRGDLEHFLEYAVLAPSSHNTQPWLFKIVGKDAVEVYADESRWLKVADSDKRELFTSVGCALENLLIAAEHYGYGATVNYFPSLENEDFVASVSFDQRPRRSNAPELFEAIVKRFTNHSEFEPTPVLPEDQLRLENCCREEGIGLYLTSEIETKRKIEDLIIRADARQFADPAFREELGYWIGQGAFGASWLIAKISQFAVTHIDLGNATAKGDSSVLMSSPVLGIICSEKNDRRTQVQVGQVFERICLKATSLGLSIQPMSQIVQVPEIKKELAALIPGKDTFPHQPFRLGFGKPETKRTPRRALEEMLI